MKYLSLCSGIEAATVAWHPMGWRPIAFAENDAFPSAVLKHHYPETPNYGDINDFKRWPDADADVVVGGTPCQSFSIAGLRAGLADPRGNLALDYLAIVDRRRPRWVVWENVPGVLSSDGGRDFGTFIAGLAELRYGFAWRVLNAEYFGLAQRRRRVFVVGHSGTWRAAAAVLFERQSLRWDSAPCRPTRKDPATDAAGSARDCSEELIPAVSKPLGGAAQDGGFKTTDVETGALIPEVANPLTARMHKGVNTTMDEGQTMIPVAFYTTQLTSPANYSVPQPGDPCRPLAGDQHPPAIAFADVADPIAANQANTYTREGSNNFRLSNVAHTSTRVRRLTPRECERLQGFPDDYTLVPYRDKLAKDGPRYRALGNSMAVPVMRWIGERIRLVETILQTTKGNDNGTSATG
jgi:DNA (cytosine-5)-methyltransferase 1